MDGWMEKKEGKGWLVCFGSKNGSRRRIFRKKRGFFYVYIYLSMWSRWLVWSRLLDVIDGFFGLSSLLPSREISDFHSCVWYEEEEEEEEGGSGWLGWNLQGFYWKYYCRLRLQRGSVIKLPWSRKVSDKVNRVIKRYSRTRPKLKIQKFVLYAARFSISRRLCPIDLDTFASFLNPTLPINSLCHHCLYLSISVSPHPGRTQSIRKFFKSRKLAENSLIALI